MLNLSSYRCFLAVVVGLMCFSMAYGQADTLLAEDGRVLKVGILDAGVEGRGELIRPLVSERAHPELDEEALRVIQLSDLWIPAEFHGVKTTTQYTFPISFALQ